MAAAGRGGAVSGGGIVGPDGAPLRLPSTDSKGRPLAGREVERDLIAGVVYGMAFIALDGGRVGVCNLEPDDCWVEETKIEATGELSQTLHLRVKPDMHFLGEPWEGIPGVAADIVAKRQEWLDAVAQDRAEAEAQDAAAVAAAEAALAALGDTDQ